jgi:hypothetical protein
MRICGLCRPSRQVGKKDLWFALSLWRFCLDHGQLGSNP